MCRGENEKGVCYWLLGSQSWTEWDQLLHSNRFRKVTREIDIKTFTDSEPVCNELQRDHVEKALKAIDSFGNFNFLGLGRRKLRVIMVADDNRTTTSGNDC